MFGFGAKKAVEPSGEFVIARLNARVQPIDRGEYFEDPLNDMLAREQLGEVTGGGTQLADEPAGIEFCDLEICANEVNEQTLQALAQHLEELGAPKGSKLIVESDGREIPFGRLEGLALFINGTDLPEETYAECDVNFVISECERVMDGGGRFRGYWEGSRETALYFYGDTYAAMKTAIEPFLQSYPLCQKARIEKIA